MKILLLAPKNARGKGTMPDYRRELASRVEAHGHRAVVLEQTPDRAGETLRAKFLRLAAECEQAVLVWPNKAAMATTADEIILLQEAYERHPLDVILILHEAEVELRRHELNVHLPADQSRYLDGILACKPYIIQWPRRTAFKGIAKQYADAFL